MYPVCCPPPPQFYITLVFHFLWVLQCILREIEDDAYSEFWGDKQDVLWGCAYGEFGFSVLPDIEETFH